MRTPGDAGRIDRRLSFRRTPTRFATFVAVALTAGGLGLTATGCGCPPNCPTPTTPHYVATRFAGAGGTVYGPGVDADGVPAIAATLSMPYDVVETADGVFIADFNARRIRKVGMDDGIITTYAGTGVAGYSGDGGPATAAQFNGTIGIDADAAGNLYVADSSNLRVRRIATNGIVTTVAGTGVYGNTGDGGPATAARIGGPLGVAVDEAGGFYIAAGTFTVRYVSPLGTITTVAGGNVGTPADGGLAVSQPLQDIRDVAYDKSARILYVSSLRGVVYSIDMKSAPATRVIRRFAGTGTGGPRGPFSGVDGGDPRSAELGEISGLAVDSTGALYLADRSNGAVLRVKNNLIWWIAGRRDHDPGNGIGTMPEFTSTATNVYLDGLIGLGARRSGYPGIYVPVSAGDGQGGVDHRVDSVYTTGSR